MSQKALEAVLACMETQVDEVSIELDCAPGYPRPGDLLPGVLEGTNIVLAPEATSSRFFGCWKWIIPEEQREEYSKVRETIKERIKALYEAGKIRYGSW